MLLFRAELWVTLSDCDWLEHIDGVVCLFRTNLWVGVLFQNTFMGGCDFLEHIYGWVCLFRKYLWVDVGGCSCSKHIYERAVPF